MSRSLLLTVLVGLGLVAAGCGSSSGTEALGAPAALVFTSAPQDAAAGAELTAIEVHVVDSHGHTITTSRANLTLALASGPDGAVLQGLTAFSASGGVSIFTGLSLDKAGTYTLSVSGAGVDPVVSTPFQIHAGAAAALKFVDQPNNIVVGGHFTKPVTVALFDAFGNTVTASGASVSLALADNPSQAQLIGTATATATNGIASFADVSVDKPGIGYTFSASAGSGVSGPPSAPFNAHAPTNFVYVDPPTGAKLRLVRNPASANGTIVLDLVTEAPLTGYAVAMNLPMDSTRVQANPTLIIPGTGLNAGTNPVAAAAGLPSSGARAGVLAVGLTQKAAGNGAVATDTAIPVGSVLFTVQIDVGGSGLGGTVFDGSALGPAFRAALLDKAGSSVATTADFAIGTLSLE